MAHDPESGLRQFQAGSFTKFVLKESTVGLARLQALRASHCAEVSSHGGIVNKIGNIDPCSVQQLSLALRGKCRLMCIQLKVIRSGKKLELGGGRR